MFGCDVCVCICVRCVRPRVCVLKEKKKFLRIEDIINLVSIIFYNKINYSKQYFEYIILLFVYILNVFIDLYRKV